MTELNIEAAVGTMRGTLANANEKDDREAGEAAGVDWGRGPPCAQPESPDYDRCRNA